MANTYNWTIVQLDTKDVNGFQDAVSTIHYRVDAVADDGTTASTYGTVGLSDPEPGDPQFVPFPSLTKARVDKWVRAKLAEGAETDAEVQARLEGQLAEAINLQQNPPVKAKTPPWK